MANALTDPPFAANPPVKVNINAKTLGLVLLILGILGIIVEALGLLAVFGLCSVGGITITGCGFPLFWLLGQLIGLAGVVIGTIGAYRMYQGNREGKDWVIYGLALGLLGAVVGLIGQIIAYSGLIGLGLGGGAIFVFIIDLVIYFIVYYIVVISRFPGDTPLAPTSYGGYGGGTPPPPPPSV
jgi:hypothetical protein